MELTRNGFPRLVITGVGVMTSLGDYDRTGENLKNGVSGVRKLPDGLGHSMDLSKIEVQIASYIAEDEFDPTQFMDRKEARRIARCSQYAVAATKLMLADAGITEEDLERDAERSGVVLGTGLGGFEMLEGAITDFQKGTRLKFSPFSVTGGLINMPAHHVSVETKAVGPVLPVTTACAAGSQSMVHAIDYLRQGMVDVMYVGGAEAAMFDYVLAGFNSMKVLATGYNDNPTEASRPFDANRNGFVYGEGVAIFALETLERALARDARIYAEVLGGAISSDAYHVSGMEPDAMGPYRSMKWALERAGVPLDGVDYINAHGTSTELNDRMETKAIKRLFGEEAYNIPVSSTKSMTGHCQGASGAIEIAACLKMLDEQVMHPTINYETPDPECDLDYIPNEARQASLDVVLTNNFGMGGYNASVVLGRF